MYGPNDDVPTCNDCGDHHPTVKAALACDDRLPDPSVSRSGPDDALSGDVT